MAFRPPRMRTPPGSTHARSALRLRDIYLYIVLFIVLCICLAFIYWSANHEVSRVVMNFVTRASDPDPSYRPPLLIVHGGMDRSIAPARVEQLAAMNVNSLRDRLSLMCGLPLSVPLTAEQEHKARAVYRHRICRVDYDIYFTSDNAVMVGHPHHAAKVIQRYRIQQGQSAPTANRTSADLRAEIEAIEAAIGRVQVTRTEVEAADPHGVVSQPLERILEVFATFIYTHTNTFTAGSDNNTRATFEVKFFPLSTDKITLRPLMERVAALVRHVAVWADVQFPTRPIEPLGASRKPFQEYLLFIVEPMRYLPHWDELMTKPKGSVIIDNVIVRPSENLTAIRLLETQPQLRYVLPLRDVALDQLREDAQLSVKQLPFTAAEFCRFLIVPPRWATAVMPSIEAVRRCTKWFDIDLHTEKGQVGEIALRQRSTGLKLQKSMARHPVGYTWKQAISKIDRMVPVITWLADSWSEYRSAVELGSFTGVRSTYIVTNNAQELLHKAHIYEK